MTALNHHEVIFLLLQVALMLILGKFFGELAKRLKQPAVVGELIAGIFLGPTILGTIFPTWMPMFFNENQKTFSALNGLTTISVILLLLIAGLEVELGTVFKVGKKSIINSLFGIIVPFVVGFSAAWFFSDFFIEHTERRLVFSLFLGIALSITALPVIARTLMDLGIYKSSIGMLIISSAMMDDIIGWLGFSIILGMMNPVAEGHIWLTLAATLSFVLFMLTLGKQGLNRILPWLNKHLSFPGGILAFSITLGLLGAAFTEYIGVHAVFGAFIVGIAIGDSIHMSRRTKEIIYDFVTNVFAPLFFVSVGLKVNFYAHFDLSLVFVVTFLAFVGKIVGCTLATYLAKFSFKEALAVGFGMNARGAMEIILATVARNEGLIDDRMFVALVVMAIVTSITSGYMMKVLLPKNLKDETTGTGYIIYGNNKFSLLVANILSDHKFNVLLINDEIDKKIEQPKGDIIVYQDKITKKNIERLDLNRFGKLLAISKSDDENVDVCKLFEEELGENSVFRLVSKDESNSGSQSLPKNTLFRGAYWHYGNIEKKIKFKIGSDDFDTTRALLSFMKINSRKNQILPLFLFKKDKNLIPISGIDPEVANGDQLIFLDFEITTPKIATPKSIKPKDEGVNPIPNGISSVSQPEVDL